MSPLAVAPVTAGSLRSGLVAALEAVDGIVASSSVPDQAVAGAGWVKWVQTEFTGHLCSTAVDTYEVLVTLPADYLAATVDQGDTFRDAIVPALSRVAVVQYVEPVAIQFQDRQTAPGIRLRVTTR